MKTNMGRARAWFRLALMQKKLPEYFKVGKPVEIISQGCAAAREKDGGGIQNAQYIPLQMLQAELRIRYRNYFK